MGAWGDESCSNDGCWDLLECVNITEMTPADIEKALSNAENAEKYTETFEKLGVVIWILRHGWTVPEKHLKLAQGWVKELIDTESWKDGWRDSKSRRRQILKEQANIEEALANGGKLKEEEHIPGLFEKMVDR